jgi:hypothetical protein
MQMMFPSHPEDFCSYKSSVLTVWISVRVDLHVLLDQQPNITVKVPDDTAASMKSSGVVLVLLLAIATASSRLSLAAAHDHQSGASIPAILGRELREFIARAGNMFRPSGAAAAAAANANAAGDAEAKNLRAVAAASRRRRPAARKSAGGAGCVSAAACRKRRVICAKRCYRASRAARLTHVPSRCVVKCRKCVPTCG